MPELIPKDEKIIQEILEASRALFTKYGLKKTTMDDVGKAVGKGKSTLYYYFPGKTELFEAVVADELKRLLKDIRLGINAESSSKGKLKAFLFARLKLKEKVHNLGQVVFDDIFDHYKEICQLKEEFESGQVEIIREIVAGGVQAGEFKSMPPQDILFFSKWIAAAFSGLEMPSSTTLSLTADEESCNKIVGFILSGIGR